MRTGGVFFYTVPVVNAAPKSVPVKAKPLPKVPVRPSLEDQEIYGFVLDWHLASLIRSIVKAYLIKGCCSFLLA